MNSALIVEDGTEFPAVSERPETLRRDYLSVIERGDTGWGAYVPDLPGVVAAADSEDEVRALIAEAVEFHLEGLRDANEAVPLPASQAFWVSDE